MATSMKNIGIPTIRSKKRKIMMNAPPPFEKTFLVKHQIQKSKIYN
jgi:hypothetical protein